MLFICTSYTVNFISFKQIYFINICSPMFSYPSCLFFCVCLALSTAWRANPESWQTWCQNANFAPSKEIYQISGLHTRYRFSLQGSGRHEQDGEKRNRHQKKGNETLKKRKTRCKRKVLDITKTPMGRLLLERRSRLSNFYPVAISVSLKIVLWVLYFTSTYRQFHAVKVWGCKKVGYYAKSPRRGGHYQSDDVVDERGEAGDDPDEELPSLAFTSGEKFRLENFWQFAEIMWIRRSTVWEFYQERAWGRLALMEPHITPSQPFGHCNYYILNTSTKRTQKASNIMKKCCLFHLLCICAGLCKY